MPNQQPETVVLDGVFHALADPTRRAVLHRLSTGPASVSDLAAPFTMALPSFLQHLKVLEDAGLIHSAKTGRVRTCEMEPAPLSNAQQWIADQRDLWSRRFDDMAAYLDELQQDQDT